MPETPWTRPPIVALVAPSGTGKTTLIEGLLAQFSGWGLRVGVVKHTHHEVEVDRPGKDSHRLRQAGAAQLLLASPWRQVRFEERAGADGERPPEPDPLDLVDELALGRLDLVLAEGFKESTLAKIELRRSALNQTALPPDANIVAIASDDPNLKTDLPLLDLNDPPAIAVFIHERFLTREKP
ncbi:MAG: molybdopterin-guanine dinucleotide biosynthesis protein B [Gammaproteobacteria bacterium]|nr:molybdopterin-guanine dinucleotide biosynthesis protein B [Gammaproteobacteria bacterium]